MACSLPPVLRVRSSSLARLFILESVMAGGGGSVAPYSRQAPRSLPMCSMSGRLCAAVCAVLLSGSVCIAQAPAPASPAAPIAAAVSAAGDLVLAPDPQSPPPKVAVEYSDAYRVRAKIHKTASIATLPLFVTEGFLGQSLYSNPSEGKKTAHLAVATGMGVLFGVNTVTGVWNLLESRKDPNHRGRRIAHSLLMLGADAGFLATAATGPGGEHGEFEGGGSRSTHRAIAFTSIGAATAGYLIMLFGGH